LRLFASLEGPKVLIHGGGKIATQLAKDMGIESKMIDGRRVTDEASLRIVTMVYAGWINKSIVAALQAEGCTSLGLSGPDGGMVRAKKEIQFPLIMVS